jgi:hypothetical protein
MKRLILALSLATAALTGCAQLKEAINNPGSEAGASAPEEQRPYPKSSSELGIL